MLDFNISLDFKPYIKSMPEANTDALVITSCDIHMLPNDDRMYSNFEDQTYNELNSSRGNLGFIDIELGLGGYSGRPYPRVYTKCFMLYTDKYQMIKPMKMTNNASESKINLRGDTVIGIRYYFRTEDEIFSLIHCNSILFECFFALGKTRNTYAIMCQLQKEKGEWGVKYANTYRPHYATNIKNMLD